MSSIASFTSASRRQSLSPRILVSLGLVYVVWGSTYLAIRMALVSFPAFMGAGLRFVIAGGLLYGLQRFRGQPHPTLRQWRDGAIVGVLLLCVGNGGVVFAEQYVSSGMAAIFIGAAPLGAALWTGLWGRWPSRSQWLGIALGFGAVAALASGQQMQAHPLGLLALLAAVACWTLGSVLSQRVLRMAPGGIGFATEMLAGGIVLLVLSALRHESIAWPLDPGAVAALVYLVVFGSLVAFSAYMYLLATVSSSLATSYAFVNPVIAVLLGVAFAGEQLTWIEGAAAVVVLASVFLLGRSGQSR